MSKAVLISIKPEWCGMITLGEKTIEVRKTRPKLEAPFKCYIYCTLPKSSGDIYFVGRENPVQGNGKVIGEFTCKSISEYEAEFHEDDDCYQDIREIFRNDDVSDDDCRNYRILTANDDDNPDNCELCEKSCLTFKEIKQYVGSETWCETFYGWHLFNLVVYDKPRELSEFVRFCAELEKEEVTEKCASCKYFYRSYEDCKAECEYDGKIPMTRPPQSWCYVEEVS